MADIVLNPAVRYELAIENNSIIYKFMISSFLKFLVLISTISFFSKLLFKDEEIFTLIKKNLKLILYLTITIPFVFSILLFLNFLIPDTTKIFVKSNINFLPTNVQIAFLFRFFMGALYQEFFYRFVLYKNSRKFFGVFSSCLVVNLIFVGVHFSSFNVNQLFLKSFLRTAFEILIIGTLVTIIFESTKSLYLATLIHFLHNFFGAWYSQRFNFLIHSNLFNFISLQSWIEFFILLTIILIIKPIKIVFPAEKIRKNMTP
jgi:membrane protease YdiL (CAAX protease family)